MKLVLVILLSFATVFGQVGKRQGDITTLSGPTDDSTSFWLSPALLEAVFGKEAVDQAKARDSLIFEHNKGRKTLFIYDKAQNAFLIKMNFISDTLEAPKTPVKIEYELVWDPVTKKLVEVPKQQ
jgi:hypothetical protein